MNRPHFHLCIATGQNLANLIPALQLDAREIVILETPEMRKSAGNLKTALEAHGIAVARLAFDDATPEATVRSAQAVALQLGERPLVFNATGGHKLMTLALAEEMKLADDMHLLYAETRHYRLDWLRPRAELEPMDDVLKLDDILIAQGYRITRCGSRDAHWMHDAAQRESLTRRLGDDAGKLARFFGTLNFLAARALANEPHGPFRPEQEFEYAPGGSNIEVLRMAHDLNLLYWDGDTKLVFADEPAARYFRGGWLEEYVWIKLRGLKPRDWAVDLAVETAQGKTPNQFDGLVAHHNRMLVIECKTSRMGGDDAKDADYIYKLAQLSRSAGGIMSRSLLLSARPVGPEALRRAQENGVDILAGADVKKLTEYLREWMA